MREQGERGHVGKINQIICVDDGGAKFYSAGDKTVKIWSCDKNQFLKELRCQLVVMCVHYTKDSKGTALIINGMSNGALRIWDDSTGRVSMDLNDNSNPSERCSDPVVAIDVYGALIAVAKKSGAFVVWNYTLGTYYINPKIDRKAVLIKYTSEDTMCHLYADGIIHYIHINYLKKSYTVLQTFDLKGEISAACVYGDYILYGTKKMEFYSYNILTRERGSRIREGNLVTSCTACQQYVALGFVDGSIEIWEMCGYRLYTMREHSTPVTALCFSNILSLLSGGEDGILNVWNPATGALIKTYRYIKNEYHIDERDYRMMNSMNGTKEIIDAIYRVGKYLKYSCIVRGNISPLLTIADAFKMDQLHCGICGSDMHDEGLHIINVESERTGERKKCEVCFLFYDGDKCCKENLSRA